MSSIVSGLVPESIFSCASWHQAQDVIDHLFDQNLTVHTEIWPVSGGLEGVKLIIGHMQEDTEAIRREVAKLLPKDNFSQLLMRG